MDNSIKPNDISPLDSRSRKHKKERQPQKKTQAHPEKNKKDQENVRDIFIHKEKSENISYARDPKLQQLLLRHTNKAKEKK